MHLTDEERAAHWTQVLYDDPTNSEAQSRLGLHWYQGNLLTTAEIDSIRERRKLEEKQLAQWKPAVARWRKVLRSGSTTEQVSISEEIARVKDTAVIPALEAAMALDAPKKSADRDPLTTFQSEAVTLLGRLSGERATYTLVQWSVMSPQSTMRTAAADALKNRAWHDFIPTLLAGLANPIQFDYSMSFDPSLGLAIYRAVESQEGRDKTTRVEYSRSASGLLPAFVGSRDSGLGGPVAAGRALVVQAASRFDTRKQTVIPGARSLSEVAGAAALRAPKCDGVVGNRRPKLAHC